ncbi:hypothetical protein [Solemya pervernicosa gill symbiont]|nr:hypothetical protein [Solemya pervernicosa gill symbiont]
MEKQNKSRIYKTLDRLQEKVSKRKKEQGGTEPVTIDATPSVKSGVPERQPVKVRGRASRLVIENAQLNLFDLEQKGRFSKHPIHPQSEFPTLLTRIPIFVPGIRSKQSKLIDQDNALPFETPWGKGRKHGPPLTVYDEDTLIAIAKLRQNLLIGQPANLPCPLSRLYQRKNNTTDDVHVHVLYCMLSDIQTECGVKKGGKANQLRLDSIKRLAAITIELDNKTANKYVGTGTTIKLIDVVWQDYEENSILYIQFTPVMARWLESEFTYIDWALRKKLTAPGKAIHRFLSGQPKSYEIHAKKLMATIQYPRAYNKFMVDLRSTMSKLKENDWIGNWEITGNGRSVPHKIRVLRT